MFFAPRDNPEIAGVVFGEHNEHGSTSAPIAKHVMETYFAKKEGKPLPKLAMPTAPDPNLEPPRSRPAPQPRVRPSPTRSPRSDAPRAGGN